MRRLVPLLLALVLAGCAAIVPRGGSSSPAPARSPRLPPPDIYGR